MIVIYHVGPPLVIPDRRRRITCGPTGPGRDELAAEFRRSQNIARVTPGSIVRPRL